MYYQECSQVAYLTLREAAPNQELVINSNSPPHHQETTTKEEPPFQNGHIPLNLDSGE